ncbi:hypothetical protein ASZ90_010444 [hydrocarbon metagenome]|uniref:Uncharacterized protein n=1 Tax=hydrocarbon metagenome TaxID=938273 RepID=A0A0W8FG31_9ZZZZ
MENQNNRSPAVADPAAGFASEAGGKNFFARFPSARANHRANQWQGEKIG